MKRLPVTALLLVAACAATPVTETSAPSLVPSLKAVAYMETGYMMDHNLREVGVYESEAMNRDARVRVRNLTCTPLADGTATCTYDASRCLPDELAAEQIGWCRRTAHFIRSTSVPPELWSDQGWSLDRPRD